MTPPFRIRPFEPSDLDDLCEVEVRLVHAQDYDDLDAEFVRERWRAYLEQGLGLTGQPRAGFTVDMLVDGGGRYAGHLLLVEQSEPVRQETVLVVGMLAVRDDLRGQGLGTKLLEHAEHVARARSIRRMRLGVHPANPALRLYERLGYQTERTVMHKVLEQP